MKILFEDHQMIFVDKPAGWYSVAPRTANDTPVLSHQMLERFPHCLPVHRLDRSTSGIMLFAKNNDAHKLACRWFEERKVKKEYRFFASPIPSAPSYICENEIEEKPSKTRFRILATRLEKNIFYGSAEPLTGRFHQVRIHAQNLGFPLLGDKRYGGDCSLNTIVKRTMLHAYRLEIPGLPKIQCDEPEDFFLMHQFMGATE